MTTDLEEPRGGVALVERRQYDGDASEHLEDLVVDASLLRLDQAAVEGNVRHVELVGQHLRLAGDVAIGNFAKLSDFLNSQQRDVLLTLNEVTVLRRSGEPTHVKVPSLWVNLDDVTLIAELGDVAQPVSSSDRPKVREPILVVTPGHTLTGEVHLAPGAELAIFVESKYPRFLPMTDVRTRSLADRRVVERYVFAVLNRDHIVATAALPAGMAPGKLVL